MRPGIAGMVSQPDKVMRIGTMIKQLLEEVKAAPLDDASRSRLRDIHASSIRELDDGLAPELRDELDRLTLPFSENEIPSDAELRIAQAQLVGWLEGLFHGIQAALFAQQMAARTQLEQMRGARSAGGPRRRARSCPDPAGADLAARTSDDERVAVVRAAAGALDSCQELPNSRSSTCATPSSSLDAGDLVGHGEHARGRWRRRPRARPSRSIGTSLGMSPKAITLGGRRPRARSHSASRVDALLIPAPLTSSSTSPE